MSNDMLQDDELDAVAGGTTVVYPAKVANSAYAAAVQAQRGPQTPAPVDRTINRTASTPALGSLRAHP